MVTKFVNNLMLHGKKSVAFKIFYDALDIVDEKIEEENALDVWKKALIMLLQVLRLEVEELVGQLSKFLLQLEMQERIYGYEMDD